MGPKEQEKLDALYKRYREARANGEMGEAVRLLNEMNELEAKYKIRPNK